MEEKVEKVEDIQIDSTFDLEDSDEVIDDSKKEEVVETLTKEYVKENMLAIDYFKIKKKYSKSCKALYDYLETKAKQKINEDMVVGVFLYSPRTVLYEFFDDNKVFINITGDQSKWTNNLTQLYNQYFESRTLAEVDAFESAFVELERRLNQ